MSARTRLRHSYPAVTLTVGAAGGSGCPGGPERKLREKGFTAYGLEREASRFIPSTPDTLKEKLIA